MWNKAKAILLASNQEAIQNDLFIGGNQNHLHRFSRTQADNYNNEPYYKTGDGKWVKQHLYIINDDVIKLSDNNEGWFLRTHSSINSVDVIQNPIFTSKYRYNKIIATTNKSLGITNHRVSPVPNFCDFPQIPQSFIEQYITEYNQGKIIESILVEYEGIEWLDKPLEYFPKINSDNTINIKPVKDSFSREEVVDLINKFERDTCPDRFEGYGTEQEDIDKFIEQNL